MTFYETINIIYDKIPQTYIVKINCVMIFWFSFLHRLVPYPHQIEDLRL